MRVTVKDIHDRIGIPPQTPGYGKVFGPMSRDRFNAWVANLHAPALTEADFKDAAEELGVSVGHMMASRDVEAPRGAYDDYGRPTILYERHVANRNTVPPGRLAQREPGLFNATGYGKKGYGPYSAQYNRLLLAMGHDVDAALKGCSWGSFQVLGENAERMSYASVLDMVESVVKSERGHLDTYVRFIKMKGLQDELRACKPNDPASCVPFVSGYNGKGFREFDYHEKFADALSEYF